MFKGLPATLAALLVGIAVTSDARGDRGALPYQEYFERYGAKYLPEYDFTLFVAQGKAESNLSPLARSRAGAMGLLQLMPKTFDEQSQRLGADCSPWSPRCSIQLGIHYDMRMFKQFKRQDKMESARFGLAAYNSGLGTVLRHQRDCDGSRVYSEVEPCLYREPREYVRRIERFKARYDRKLNDAE